MKPSVIVWDLETVLPDLGGFAAANDLVGKSDVEVREAIGDKFPKHIYHSIVCIGARTHTPQQISEFSRLWCSAAPSKTGGTFATRASQHRRRRDTGAYWPFSKKFVQGLRPWTPRGKEVLHRELVWVILAQF
jgi:hypothetical protein